MSERAGSPGRFNGALRILAAVFTFAAVGSLALVVVDLIVGRPASGDVFITVLNSFVAMVLWRQCLNTRGYDKGTHVALPWRCFRGNEI